MAININHVSKNHFLFFSTEDPFLKFTPSRSKKPPIRKTLYQISECLRKAKYKPDINIKNPIGIKNFIFVTPQGIEPWFLGWKPNVLTSRLWGQKKPVSRLGFEPRTLCLKGKSSNRWATGPSLRSGLAFLRQLAGSRRSPFYLA